MGGPVVAPLHIECEEAAGLFLDMGCPYPEKRPMILIAILKYKKLHQIK